MKSEVVVSLAATCLLLIAVATPVAMAASYSENHDEVLIYFRSDAEKSVLAAEWTGETFLAIGRYNKSGRQDGFAMYVCAVLDDYGFKGKRITVDIIDAVKLTQKQWEVIGRARCN